MNVRTIPRIALLCAALALTASTGAAQEPGGPPPSAQRDTLEARVRLRMAQVVKRQLGLTDDQMRKLGETNRRFEVQRRELLARERDVRMDLRDEMESGDTTRQAQVSRLLDQMIQLQRQRVDQIESEQKDLATFLTPIQRARYFAMEEQIRRRVMEMREEGMRPAPGGVRRPPGGQPGAGRPGAVAPRGGVRRPGAGAS